MPDLVRLRNITRDELMLAPLGRAVGPDCVVDVPRDLHQRLAWPATVWRDETPARKPDASKEA